MCSARSTFIQDLYGKVGLLSVSVRRGRLSVGTCLARLDYCRDVSGEVGLVSGHVRRGRLSDGTCSVRWGIVGTYSARSG